MFRRNERICEKIEKKYELYERQLIGKDDNNILVNLIFKQNHLNLERYLFAFRKMIIYQLIKLLTITSKESLNIYNRNVNGPIKTWDGEFMYRLNVSENILSMNMNI